MRLVFIGTGDIGLPAFEHLLCSGTDEVVGVVTQPDKPAGRRQELLAPRIKQLAREREIPVFQPVRMRDPAAVAEVVALEPEVIVVMAYGQILPAGVLEAPSLACINLHASLLPRHRGAAPVHAAIEAGDAASGITVMHVTAALDSGDMILRKAIPIRRRETAGSLHDRLASLAPEALREALDALRNGSAARVPQDPAAATYAPKLTREYGVIDWTQPHTIIERKIRAMNPWPAASTILPESAGNARKLKVFSALPRRRGSGRPGEVLSADSRGILVAAGQGSVLLREVQLEGKKRMRAADFLRGNALAPGTLLGG